MLSSRSVLQRKHCVKNALRCLSITTNQRIQTPSKKPLSSNELRSSFIEFFVQNHNHDFVRSSPVKPTESSLLFVNAGMNQFKPIFLDQLDNDDMFAQFRALNRAANSQKCIRLGGKHCDLESVGKDFTHHSFFEMLGNWSFNDYFKKEACEMAWTLLTKVYGIDPSRLFVSIFAGDKSLNLPRDEETYDIWRSIGVPANRIVELGMKDNFWEMGETGPCGICTEIHYELHPASDCDMKTKEQRDKALLDASVEIWNLVFIQYFRHTDGSLTRLNKNFVDTGMGLERILSLVQGVNNNYQTDLFTPFFQRIHTVTGWPEYSGKLENLKDITYRILADHSRMTAIAIADGVVPDDRGSGYLLRKVIRRSLDAIRGLSNENLSLPVDVTDTKLLLALADTTVETLGDAFPELKDNVKNIHKVLEEEIELNNSAIQRNPQLMKLANSLQINLSDDLKANQQNIIEKCDMIDAKLDSVEKGLNLSRPNILQNELDFAFRDVSNLRAMTISDKALSERFNLKNGEIDERLTLLQDRVDTLQILSDNYHVEILQLFKVITKRKLQQADCYSVLNFSDEAFEYDSIGSLLLKLASDLYGLENPLLVIMKQPKENCFMVQMTVPEEFKNSLNSYKWLQETIAEFEKSFDPEHIYPFYGSRRKRNSRNIKCRVRCQSEEDVNRFADIFQKDAIDILQKSLNIKSSSNE